MDELIEEDKAEDIQMPHGLNGDVETRDARQQQQDVEADTNAARERDVDEQTNTTGERNLRHHNLRKVQNSIDDTNEKDHIEREDTEVVRDPADDDGIDDTRKHFKSTGSKKRYHRFLKNNSKRKIY